MPGEIPPSAKQSSETPHTGSYLQKLRTMTGAIWGEIREHFTGPQTPHPDFRIVWELSDALTWYQNKDWGPLPEPPYKIGFYFNDVSVLNDCPWICKFGNNLNKKFPAYKYFCVGYGNPAKWESDFDLANMTEWAMRFDHPSLMKYSGTLIKMLKE